MLFFLGLIGFFLILCLIFSEFKRSSEVKRKKGTIVIINQLIFNLEKLKLNIENEIRQTYDLIKETGEFKKDSDIKIMLKPGEYMILIIDREISNYRNLIKFLEGEVEINEYLGNLIKQSYEK